MNYRLRDKQLKRKGFGITETVICILIILVLFGAGLVFGESISKGFYSFRRMILPNDGAVVGEKVENALISALQSENDQLKSLLGRTVDKEQMILAAVLVRPPQTPYDSIIIDAGTNLGIIEGDIIYAKMNYAIGRVVSVSKKTSVITLFSSSGQKANVFIGTSTTSVTAEGRGGGNYYIKLPRNIEIAVGDPIVWPDIQTILLGTVEVVDTGNGDAYANIYFKSPVNINTLRYVQFKAHTR